MKTKIPEIIHQIWSGVDEPLPDHFKALGDTWKEHHPDWQYMLWDNEMMNDFVKKHYPGYWDIYNKFPYNIQRWDAIRYLILDTIGGMYVDFDYECLSPMDGLFKDKSCCFALEPELHLKTFNRIADKIVDEVFNNALMLNVPGHPFMQKVVKTVFSESVLDYQGPKDICVYNTTGPWMLIDLYYESTEEEKKLIYLIPAKYVTPFDVPQTYRFRMGEISDELENCLEEAYAVHYFFGNWKRE